MPRPPGLHRGPPPAFRWLRGDPSGRDLGEHGGIDRYTVGQRKGLGVGFGERRFVLKIVPEVNEVVLGEREHLLSAGLRASGLNWLGDAPTGRIECDVKIRYRHVPARATVDGDLVVFAQPQQAVAPGQAVVFYDGDRVLGGGWIEEALG